MVRLMPIIIEPINPDELPLEIGMAGKYLWNLWRSPKKTILWTTFVVYGAAVFGLPVLTWACPKPLEGEVISKLPCDYQPLEDHMVFASNTNFTTSSGDIVSTLKVL